VPIPITVPRLGWSMDEGIFVEWLKRDGEIVSPGEPLFALESDKATEQIEALDAGILRIPPDSPPPGATVKVGQVLAYLAAEGEDIRSQESGIGGQEAGVRAQESRVSQTESSPRMSAAIPGGRDRAGSFAVTPRARRIARELHIDVAALSGSGRHGRIRERDVRAAAAHQTPGRLIPHTPTRRTIAARMVAGVTQAAPVTLTTKADATRLIALRNQLTTNGPAAPSYTDLILLLTAAALRQHPLLQAQWRDDGLFVPDAIDIAIAVDVEFGLLAPVVRHVDQLGVNEIAAQTRDLIAQARAGKLTPDQMRGATFTVTNLGMFGIDAFTPIIQLPQCAVLGVGRIVKEPAVVQDRIEPRDMITLSLTFDHRVVDGAPAARFLDALRRAIGQPPPVG
jgi:pyruvate dehydrogenase E2 component (dihydrolipoyllysine-residue acetyltransferase)